jgi:hypothetical protein
MAGSKNFLFAKGKRKRKLFCLRQLEDMVPTRNGTTSRTTDPETTSVLAGVSVSHDYVLLSGILFLFSHPTRSYSNT